MYNDEQSAWEREGKYVFLCRLQYIFWSFATMYLTSGLTPEKF